MVEIVKCIVCNTGESRFIRIEIPFPEEYKDWTQKGKHNLVYSYSKMTRLNKARTDLYNHGFFQLPSVPEYSFEVFHQHIKRLSLLVAVGGIIERAFPKGTSSNKISRRNLAKKVKIEIEKGKNIFYSENLKIILEED